MQENDFIHRTQFPSIQQRQPSISNVFHMIRLKKEELAKKIEGIDRDQPKQRLPNIVPITYDNYQNDNQSKEDHSKSSPTVKSNQQINYVNDQSKVTKTQQSLMQGNSDLPHQSINMNRLSQQYQLSNIFNMQKQQNKEHIGLRMSKLNMSVHNGDKIRTKTQLNDFSERKMTNPSLHGKPEEQSILDTMKLAKQKFKGQFELIPSTVKSRNQQNLSPALKLLETFNPFFNRIQRVISVCLLKMSKLIYREAHTVLYKPDEEIGHFYVILLGKIRLSNNSSFRRICQTGETFLQQIIFSQKGKKLSLDRAKTITGSYMLEIKLHEYKKIKEELIRYGYKIGLNQMEAVIKRNFIIKNWMRNKTKQDIYY